MIRVPYETRRRIEAATADRMARILDEAGLSHLGEQLRALASEIRAPAVRCRPSTIYGQRATLFIVDEATAFDEDG